MRKLAIATPLFALGCARTTVETVSRSVEAVSGEPSTGADAASFVAAVPAFESGGHCAAIRLAGGDRLTVLRFDGPAGARRTVSLRFAADGTLRAYSDVRGGGERGSAETVVTVGFVNHTATAMNRNAPEGSGATPGLVLSTPEAMLDLENAGAPRRMIERVKARCGG